MKKVYLVQIEDAVQGMFDVDHDLIASWSPNDATWSDYFDDLMEWANVEVFTDLWHEDADLYKELQEKLAKLWSLEDGWQDWG